MIEGLGKKRSPYRGQLYLKGGGEKRGREYSLGEKEGFLVGGRKVPEGKGDRRLREKEIKNQRGVGTLEKKEN